MKESTKRSGMMLVVAVVVLLASSLWAAAPAGRYTIDADTVKVNKTGLTWQRVVPTTAARTMTTRRARAGFGVCVEDGD